MDVSDHIHAPAALLTRIIVPNTIGQKTVWAPKPVNGSGEQSKNKVIPVAGRGGL
jgi:hypothetical protein